MEKRMFINDALAQDAASVGAGASVAANLIQILLIFFVFYLLLIRPQQKKMKQHEMELKAIKTGDEVITAGGIYAVVKSVNEDDLMVEISKGVEVKVHRYTIREVLKKDISQQKKTKTKGKKNV